MIFLFLFLKDTSTLYDCGSKPDQQDGCVKKDDDKPEYCVCTGDLCNSSSTIDINLKLALSCLIIVFFKIVLKERP